MSDKKINFEKEVAETLGIEAAVILELYQLKNFDNSITEKNFFDHAIDECSFMTSDAINKSIDKLKKVNLISFDNNQDTKESLKNTFELKTPKQNTKESKIKISQTWLPEKETIEVIEMGGIPIDFAKSKLKEFKIYWVERNQARDNWNILFIDFIRREWAKENSSNKGMPYCIDKKWTPNEDVYAVLSLSQITKETALKYLKEFIIYWEENGTALKSWNSKFIEYVKRKELNIVTNNGKENNRINEPGKFTKGFTERKSDQSWAKEFKF